MPVRERPVVRGLVKAAATLADVLLPPLCLACHGTVAHHDSVCAACWREVHFITPPLCDRLGLPLSYDTGGVQISAEAAANPPDFDRARAAAHYAGPVRRLIHLLKYNDRLEPCRLLGRWLAVAGRDLLKDAHVLIPVPLARGRLLSRRFNQSALLARHVSTLCGLPFAPEALVRTRNTAQQVGLTSAQRVDNVRGAFEVSPESRAALAHRHVVLVDDVITTGATVNACARALRKAGAARVDVLAVAMATAQSRLGLDGD